MDRRSFFKTLIGAVVAARVVPTVIKTITKKDLWQLYGGAAGAGKTMAMSGIPYQENNGTAGTWLGIERSQKPQFLVMHPAQAKYYQELVKNNGDLWGNN